MRDAARQSDLEMNGPAALISKRGSKMSRVEEILDGLYKNNLVGNAQAVVVTGCFDCLDGWHLLPAEPISGKDQDQCTRNI